MRKCCVVAVVLLMVAGVAMARTVQLTPVKDSGMYAAAGAGNSNRGDGGRWDINAGSDDSALLQFDVSGVTLAAGESISAVTLECFSASGGPYSFDWTLVAYPLVDPWQEGVGNAGSSGDLGFPWGPASVGDAVYNYKVVSAIGAGAAPFNTTLVATAGTAWNTAGARGLATDVLDRKMMESVMSAPNTFWTPPMSFGVMDFTAEGVAVVDEWVAGTLDNNGFSMWASDGTGQWRGASRENPAGGAAILELTIVPEPATMALLGLGTLGLAALRRRRRATA